MMATRIANRSGTVEVNDPWKCFECRSAYIVATTFAGRFINRHLVCTRRDCDRWLTKGADELAIPITTPRADAGREEPVLLRPDTTARAAADWHRVTQPVAATTQTKGLLEAVGVKLFAWLLVLGEMAAIAGGFKFPSLDEAEKERRRKTVEPDASGN